LEWLLTYFLNGHTFVWAKLTPVDKYTLNIFPDFSGNAIIRKRREDPHDEHPPYSAEVHANGIHASGIHASEFHANEFHANEFHANEFHASEFHANV
jgi:hypothetical protein